jgi:hypothetical protein
VSAIRCRLVLGELDEAVTGLLYLNDKIINVAAPAVAAFVSVKTNVSMVDPTVRAAAVPHVRWSLFIGGKAGITCASRGSQSLSLPFEKWTAAMSWSWPRSYLA